MISAVVSGTAKNMPTVPNNQPQNSSAINTASVEMPSPLPMTALVGLNGLALSRHYNDETVHKPDFKGAAWRIQNEERLGDVLLVDEEGSRKSSGPAEAPALQGRHVVMIPDGIDPLAEIMENHAERPVFDRLRAAGVMILSDVIVQEIAPGAVTIVGRYDGVERTLKAPVVLHAGRHRADDALCLELIERGIDARPVGDARSRRRWEDAIHDGYLVASAI